MARKKVIFYETTDDLMAAYFPKPTKEGKEQAKNQPKEPIKLRAKKLNNCLSLYLDCYQDGKRQYQFLNLYLNIETDDRVKEQNRQNFEIAKTVQQEKIVSLNKTGAGIIVTSKGKVNLIKYILLKADKELERTGNKHSLYYTLCALAKHLSSYAGDKIRFCDVDKDFILGFIDYLRTAKNNNYTRTGKSQEPALLAQNTQHNLFLKFNYILKKAIEDGLISTNPVTMIELSSKPKAEEGTREFLSIEEVKKLIATPCRNPSLKAAFLFCCLVGLRYSDVSKLTWGEKTCDAGGFPMLRFKMKKVGRENTPYLSTEALKWVPERGNAADADLIYDLPRNDSANYQLAKWVKDAGISKKITFHCSRHTAATLNLALGVPIELISRMLGHTKLATTQIYTKLIDNERKKAINKQIGMFD